MTQLDLIDKNKVLELIDLGYSKQLIADYFNVNKGIISRFFKLHDINMKTIKIDKDELVKLYYSGYKITKLAKIFHCSHKIIQNYLSKYTDLNKVEDNNE